LPETAFVYLNNYFSHYFFKWRTSEANAEGCKMALWCIW